ncbi:MAG: glycoside hydrolase family 32 protein [Maribacter sp.]
MKIAGYKVLLLVFLISIFSCKNQEEKVQTISNIKTSGHYAERYRPQFHFSPQEKWMNDPNGLVHYKNTYHLFYQYYPDSTVWGPMHWGHAISKDMIKWEHKPVALYPDEHGLIFSGSAVIDSKNTSGFGTLENPPMVAIFTYHLMAGEKAGRTDFQTQGIAYSLDEGNSWIKYVGNPVIGNPGIKDFRDPKVFWNEKLQLWSMLLVAGDHMQVWNSQDLKSWEQVSEFGKDKGAHGGVWECPDLFPLKIEGTEEEKWVLLISINPGAPNGGSGTQYFIGDFDGNTFTTEQKSSRWIDLGRDNYAGVTYNNAPNGDRIFIGWMSNWDYARDTPTVKWRSAMTLPRKLSLKKINESYELINYPLESLNAIVVTEQKPQEIIIKADEIKTIELAYGNTSEIQFKTTARDFMLNLNNSLGDSLIFGMEGQNKEFIFDRTRSGRIDFKDNFALGIQKMPISNLPDGPIEVRILLDHSSVEIFINKGQYVMTNQIFPNEMYKTLEIFNPADQNLEIIDFVENKVERIWD